MEYLTLPQTDLKVSKIALGCMRIADKSIEEVEELVKTALESGINFFDHADIYGGGKSEELFGEVLKRHPEYNMDDRLLLHKINKEKNIVEINGKIDIK